MMRTGQNAFTLIELMIAVAIVGILASIVYPSYQSYITKSKEAAAQAALVSFASAMSQYYMEDYVEDQYHKESMSYKCAATGGTTTGNCPTGKSDTGTPWIFSDRVPLDSDTKTYYDLTIDTATKTKFTLKATPVDSSWRTFCIDEQGIKDDCNGTKNWD